MLLQIGLWVRCSGCLEELGESLVNEVAWKRQGDFGVGQSRESGFLAPALRSFGYEHDDLAQCTHLSSCIHWVIDLLCAFQAMESQVPCSAHRHWPPSTLKTSQKASCIQPTSWAPGEEKGLEP